MSNPPEAIVIGAGIGGVTAACALHDAGWRVTLLEQAPVLEPVGSALVIAPNGLRALGVIGAAEPVRALAAIQGPASLHRPDGRVLAPASAEAFERRFGDPLIAALRAEIMEVLLGRLPEGALRTGETVREVEPGGPDTRARVTTGTGVWEADLVVAADGIRSATRGRLFPDHPAPRYAGFTTWRAVIPTPVDVPARTGEAWGRGQVFGSLPLSGGRTYWYATANREAGATAADERAEVLDLYGGWHRSFAGMIEATAAERILRLDVHETAHPLPAFHRGRVALLGDAAHAMTPNLGQGGNQALEDAVVLAGLLRPADPRAVAGALDRYTALRLPRTSAIVQRSHRMGRVTRLENRVAVAARDTALRLFGRLSPDAALRPLDDVMAWRP